VYNGAKVTVKNKNISVLLKKKTHLPILLENSWLKETTKLSWLDASVNFDATTIS